MGDFPCRLGLNHLLYTWDFKPTELRRNNTWRTWDILIYWNVINNMRWFCRDTGYEYMRTIIFVLGKMTKVLDWGLSRYPPSSPAYHPQFLSKTEQHFTTEELAIGLDFRYGSPMFKPRGHQCPVKQWGGCPARLSQTYHFYKSLLNIGRTCQKHTQVYQ
jgi:hypothetical protein